MAKKAKAPKRQHQDKFANKAAATRPARDKQIEQAKKQVAEAAIQVTPATR